MAKNKLPAGLLSMLTAIAATSTARQHGIDAGLDNLAAGADDESDPRVTVLEIDMSSKESVGSQIERQIAKAAAKHREECDACCEEYEAEQAAKKAKKQAHSDLGTSPASTEAKDRLVVGYMVFQGERPLPETFDANKKVVVVGVQEAFGDGLVRALIPAEYINSLSVRPVFGN